MVSNGEMINLTSKKTYKTVMKLVIRDTFSKLILIILRNCRRHSDLPFLPKRVKIVKCKKLVHDLHDKKNYVIHIT